MIENKKIDPKYYDEVAKHRTGIWRENDFYGCLFVYDDDLLEYMNDAYTEGFIERNFNV